MFNAIVIGGTGATGRRIIEQLLAHEKYKTVTAIGRRRTVEGEGHDKLNDVLVDSMSDLSSTASLWMNNDVFFNCIGTTRAKAGGAKQFVEIELGISREAAKMASMAKIHHASLISASGANHESWAVDWLHPLLYAKTMGQKEQTVLSEFSFNRVSIFKPGMLIRMMNEPEWYDGITEKLGIGLRVDILAAAMINDAERRSVDDSFDSPSIFTGNSVIKNTLGK
tara:strand:+ start:11266 stop:11937 length:672 start_codon:yes stop_codon:yes gene_type:complete